MTRIDHSDIYYKNERGRLEINISAVSRVKMAVLIVRLNECL